MNLNCHHSRFLWIKISHRNLSEILIIWQYIQGWVQKLESGGWREIKMNVFRKPSIMYGTKGWSRHVAGTTGLFVATKNETIALKLNISHQKLPAYSSRFGFPKNLTFFLIKAHCMYKVFENVEQYCYVYPSLHSDWENKFPSFLTRDFKLVLCVQETVKVKIKVNDKYPWEERFWILISNIPITFFQSNLPFVSLKS